MEDSYIIAIDLGTSYSGYAYNITPAAEDIKPFVKQWGKELGLETPKTPNCILFDLDQKFKSFGYEARTAFTSMKPSEIKQCYFFDNFKMALYGKQRVKETLTLTSVNGKTMNALTVFTASLHFLKYDALKTINNNSKDVEFKASDFTWVLTVPAIWDDAAKQFMREAATRAGIVSKDSKNRLVIALEPEAASIWCKKLPANGFLTDNHSRKEHLLTPGTQYIVVDCGGGTIDITAHEVLKNGRLKELQKASGNNMGGQTVDQNFLELLKEVFGECIWDEYKEKFPNEVQELLYDFRIMKQVDQSAQFSCPYNLGQLASKTKEMQLFFNNNKSVSWNQGRIKISQVKMKSFFAESLRGITARLEGIHNKTPNVKYFLLVGGYALSQVLRDHIENYFGNKCNVLCPHLPQEVVMKGAVLFGKDRAAIESRKSAYTYGYDIVEKFDASKHKQDKKFTDSEGEEWCNNLFRSMVQIDEGVGWDETKQIMFNPIRKDQRKMAIAFYRTEKKTASYVDEAELVGRFEVEMPDTKGGTSRQVRMDVIFGDTEIRATATDLVSETEAKINIDFISTI